METRFKNLDELIANNIDFDRMVWADREAAVETIKRENRRGNFVTFNTFYGTRYL